MKTTLPKEDVATSNPSEKIFDPNEKLFIASLMEMYWREKHLVQALPVMLQKSTANEIATAIENHLEETKQHVTTLETVFSLLNREAKAKKCLVMEALTLAEEGATELVYDNTEARDQAIVLSARKVEHFEIACYKGLIKLATELKFDKVVPYFTNILKQEKAADEILATISENK